MLPPASTAPKQLSERIAFIPAQEAHPPSQMGLCRCYHSCCGNEKASEVYTPRGERWCTDVLCLVLLLLAWGGMGTLGYMCVVVTALS